MDLWSVVSRGGGIPNSERVCEYGENARHPDDDVGMHIAQMLSRWRAVRHVLGGEFELKAACCLTDTLPVDWNEQAENLYQEQVWCGPYPYVIGGYIFYIP